MKIEPTLKAVIYSALFLIPFIPLVVADPLFFPFITGKAFLFRVIVEIAFGAWAILAIAEPRYRPQSSWIIKGFGAFITVMLVADIFGQNIWRSLFSNFERMEGWITLIHLFAYFVVLSSMLLTEKMWKRYLNTTLVASLIVAFYGLFQFFGWLAIQQSDTRLDATLGNAAYLAIYMYMHVAIAALLLYRSYRLNGANWLVYAYGATIVLESAILYETATRGTVIGYIAAILLGALIFAVKTSYKRVRQISIGILVAVAVIIVAFIALKNVPAIKNNDVLGRFASISLTDTTTQSRFLLWHMALEGAKEHPILGWGQENFNLIFNKYYDPKLFSDEQRFDSEHDVFFDWLTAGGILGLLSYLSIFAAAAFMLWRPKSEEQAVDHSKLSPSERRALHTHGLEAKMPPLDLAEKVIITGFFVGYFIHNIFVFDNISSYLIFAVMLAYVHARSAAPFNSRFSTFIASDNAVQLSVWGGIILTIVVAVGLNWAGYEANVTLIKALSIQCQDASGQATYCLPNGPEDNLAAYKDALAYNSFGNQEIRERLLDTASSIDSASSIATSTQQDFYDLAASEMAKQFKETPNDARPYVLYASYLMSISQYSAALPYAEEGLKLSPTKQTIMFLIMANDIQLKQYDPAFAIAKQAYDEETSDPDSVSAYATAAIYDSKPDVVASLYPAGVPASYQFAKAYFDIGDYSKAIPIFKALALATPTDPQLGVSLSVAYFEAGDKADAIAELTLLETNFPQDATIFAGFISDIRAGKNPLSSGN